MGNAFGLGGLGWLGVGGPVGGLARTASSASATLDSAKNLGSATTFWDKAKGAWQLQHNASFLKRNLFGRKSKKPNKIQLEGTGRGTAIIPMSAEEKKKNKEEERKLYKNILTGKFRQNLINQNTSPPLIKPQGEFAEIPFLKEKMKKFSIEGLTRENFIDLFIEKILEFSKYNYAFARDEITGFRTHISGMTFSEVRNLIQNILNLEKEIKDKQSSLNENRKIYNNTKKDANNFIKKIEEEGFEEREKEINILIKKKDKGLEIKKGIDDFFSNPLFKKNTESRIKLCKDKFKIDINDKNKKFFEINLFITRNYWDFYRKITGKIRELTQKINEIRENGISANERYIIKIHAIIRSHEDFFNVLSILFNHIINNKNEEDREADIQKLIEMKIIIDKILEKNTVGYEYKLAIHTNKKHKNGIQSHDFRDIIIKYYQNIKNAEIAKRKIKREKNHRETFFGGIKVAEMTTKATKEIEEKNLDITGLLTTLNNLIVELYKKYNLQDPLQMKNTVPPITLHKSLNYAKLIDMIINLYKKKNKPDEYIKILKLKLYIDEFMNRLGGSNYEIFKLEYDSRILDKGFKKKIPDFENEVTKLKAEISKKSNEELRTEANELLDEFKSDIDKFNNSNKIGNISNLRKSTNAANQGPANLANAGIKAQGPANAANTVTQAPANAANTVTQAPINSKTNKLPNAANSTNSTNAASVASTRNGNGNGNQSVVMNSELPPFKNNLRQQSQLQQQNVR